jgi:predicted permease
VALFQWMRRRRPVDHDLQEEIYSHLAMAAQDRVADGADPETARLAARREFGNVTLATEASQRIWSIGWIEAARDLLQDGRYAVRLLPRSPGFSLIVIAVLALGIGLNAAVFTLFKGLALKPLPGVDGSAGLGVVMAQTSAGRPMPLSYPDYQYLRDHDRAFAGLAGSSMSMFSLGLGNRGERVWGEFVTGSYFQLFGVRARLGRTLLPSDEVAPGKHPVVVISDGLWRRAFGSDPDIVGKTVNLNAYPLTVVGVTDPAFHGAVVSLDVDAFVPLMMVPQLGLFNQAPKPGQLYDRKVPLLVVFGRLLPGTTLATASAQAAVLSTRLAADAPLQDYSQRVMVLPIWRSPYGAQTYMLPAVVVLGAMGALLLLIVCANVAGLVLVRGISRRGEIAVRLALGASRARILRLLFIENLVLAVPGAALGLLLAWRALPLLWSGAAGGAPGRMFLDVSVDRIVIGFAVLSSCASALFFGFIPALRSSRVDLVSVMKDDLSPRGAARGRFRAALVVAQVAVSLLLLVGAGLVARSLDAARRADAGFDPRNVTSLTMDLRPNGYDEARGRAFYQQLLDTVRADDGIDSASLAAIYPMTMVDSVSQKFVVEGYQPRRDEDLIFLFNVVTPDYFRTLRIRLVTGREFDPRDDASAPQVAIVNDTLARRFWGSAPNAIGKRLRLAAGESRTVVGVAGDVKYARINEDPRPFVYLPFLQSYTSNMILHTRGSAGPVKLLEQARGHVQTLDPNLPILEAKSLSEQTNAALGVFEMTARTLLIFGVAAMGLAAMGIYGLVSYTVKQSTHEIGIRMALGARRADVIMRFLGRGLRLGTIGAAVGIVASLVVTRLLGTLLYGVSATDAVSFATASVVVLGSVVVATLIPAWRAARTNPMAALRHQ